MTCDNNEIVRLSMEIRERASVLFSGVNRVRVYMENASWWEAELLVEEKGRFEALGNEPGETEVRLSVESRMTPEEALTDLLKLLNRVK